MEVSTDSAHSASMAKDGCPTYLEKAGELAVSVVDILDACPVAKSIDTVAKSQQGAVDVSSFLHSLPTVLCLKESGMGMRPKQLFQQRPSKGHAEPFFLGCNCKSGLESNSLTVIALSLQHLSSFQSSSLKEESKVVREAKKKLELSPETAKGGGKAGTGRMGRIQSWQAKEYGSWKADCRTIFTFPLQYLGQNSPFMNKMARS